MPYLKLKTSKLNFTQLGGTYQLRPNKGAPTPPPPTPVGVTPSCMNVTYMLCLSPGAAHGVDSSELVSLPLHAPVGVTPSCMNVTYELSDVTSTSLPPTAGESYPSCMNVTCVSPGAAHGVDSSELVAAPSPCPGGSYSFLYECYVRVVRAHLHPPPPSHRGELPFLYECNLRIVYFPRGFVSHPQPPGGVSLSCVNVAYTVVFP